MREDAPTRFFMGANTPNGFFGYPDDLYDPENGWRAFLIKGGPGTGKSSLIRRVMAEGRERDEETECLFCSSDPHSLDGVIFPQRRICVVDATAPHVMEPRYWGAVEQLVDLGECLDTVSLSTLSPVVRELTRECGACHQRVRNFLGAAASLLAESRRMADEVTDADKVKRLAARLAAREFCTREAREKGGERRRFLSAVTHRGQLTFFDTVQALCPRIYVLEDEYGAASTRLLQELRERAAEAGWDSIVCFCPLDPAGKPEHLLIPALGVGFVTSNPWHKVDFPVFRRIHAARFTDVGRLRRHKQRLSFNRRATRELFNEAVCLAGEAKRVHDELEEIYGAHMDWSAADKMGDRLIEVIFGNT